MPEKAPLQVGQYGEQGLDRSGAQATAALAAPADCLVGEAGVVLERHFEGYREAAEGVPHILRSERPVDLGVLVVRIAVHVLKVGAGALERGAERALQRVLLGRESGQPLATVDEYVRQALVAVHVEKGVDAGLVQGGTNMQHLGTAL